MVKSLHHIWDLLEEVFDPEVPVLSVVDLGIIRSIDKKDEIIEVTITPTYIGCPAMQTIAKDIETKLRENGISNLTIETSISPAWTTDWMSEEGKRKLKEYGITPPQDEPDKSILFAEPIIVPCPRCDSNNTKMVSRFGSTACKAHYQCNQCLEPFDYFKCFK
jgi:ring-1,2-phenylacetyl-CoA epoxidase subunit PaaD